MTIYPTVIAPLFNKFTPLEEGELRDKIFQLAQRVNFPLKKLFVVDGSTRSNHSNAYFYGFFNNKRIVLFDTLLTQVNTQGIVAIIGHELGHYKFSHTLKNLIITQVHFLLFFFLFGQMLNADEMYSSFGFTPKPVFIGLFLFSFVYGPIEHIFGLAMNFLSRHFEYQADHFAVDLGFDLNIPLAKIHQENLGNMNPDPWYSTYHYSHPTLLERLRAMDAIRTKQK